MESAYDRWIAANVWELCVPGGTVEAGGRNRLSENDGLRPCLRFLSGVSIEYRVKRGSQDWIKDDLIRKAKIGFVEAGCLLNTGCEHRF